MLAFPEARNQILIRIENISDLFDETSRDSAFFNVHEFARNLYSETNSSQTPNAMLLTERTLGNNQDWNDWKEEKLAWDSEDTHEAVTYPADDGERVALQPQRIRLFRVIYNDAHKHVKATQFSQITSQSVSSRKVLEDYLKQSILL